MYTLNWWKRGLTEVSNGTVLFFKAVEVQVILPAHLFSARGPSSHVQSIAQVKSPVLILQLALPPI